MTKTPRIHIPKSVRKYVFARNNFQCQCCGKTASETDLTIDHIIPLARGGKNDISNLHTLCGVCNQRKSDRIDFPFRRQFEL